MIEQRVWTGYSKEGHFMQLVMNKEEASPYKGPPLIHYVFQCGKEQVETNHLPFLQIKILLRQILEESRWKGAEIIAQHLHKKRFRPLQQVSGEEILLIVSDTIQLLTGESRDTAHSHPGSPCQDGQKKHEPHSL
jgi:hypothetical protein